MVQELCAGGSLLGLLKRSGPIGEERAAQGAPAGVELADAARNQIDQNVGVANLLQCFLYIFSVHRVLLIMGREVR